MKIIAWLLNKIKGCFSKPHAAKRKEPSLVVKFGVTSHEISDEEFEALKIKQKESAKAWRALGKDEQKGG